MSDRLQLHARTISGSTYTVLDGTLTVKRPSGHHLGNQGTGAKVERVYRLTHDNGQFTLHLVLEDGQTLDTSFLLSTAFTVMPEEIGSRKGWCPPVPVVIREDSITILAGALGVDTWLVREAIQQVIREA